MASQGGTKYEDRTMPRGASAAGGNGTYGRARAADAEHIALGDLPGYEARPPPPGGVRLYPPPVRGPGDGTGGGDGWKSGLLYGGGV